MQTLLLLSSVLSVEAGKWVPPVSFKLPCFSSGSDGKKKSASNGEDLGSVPGLGRSLGEGNGNPVQYSCLENAMDSRAWQAIGYRLWGHKELDTTEQLSHSPSQALASFEGQ